LCHLPGTEPPLKCSADVSPVKLANASDCIDGILFVLHDEARFAVGDNFRDRATWKGDHWGAAGHRLDHHQSERLRPIDGKQQGLCSSEKGRLVMVADFPYEFHLLPV
jgi:hypothetical protein